MTSAFFNLCQRVVAGFCGALFVGAGAFKLTAPFGNYLQILHVPLPQIAALAVSALEIGGGATLLFHRRARHIATPKIRRNFLRLVCVALAVDMISAIFLVGIPGKRGQTHAFKGHVIGAEAWRLPLEIFLLLTMLFFVFQPPCDAD